MRALIRLQALKQLDREQILAEHQNSISKAKNSATNSSCEDPPHLSDGLSLTAAILGVLDLVSTYSEDYSLSALDKLMFVYIFHSFT